jgi:hypothetical protein
VAQGSCDRTSLRGHSPAPTSQEPGSTSQPASCNSASAPTWSPSKSSPFLFIVHGYPALWQLLGTGSTPAIFPVYFSPTFVRTHGAWSLWLSGLGLMSSPSLVFLSCHRHRSLTVCKLPFDCMYLLWKAYPDRITTKRGHEHPLPLV